MPIEHRDLVRLIRGGVVPGTWADLGSGRGAFTQALADLLGPGARIVSVDRDDGALREQRRELSARFPDAQVEYHHADLTRPPDLPVLDGALMANSLHFVRDRAPVLARVLAWLRPGGRLVLVEYDTDRGNRWVPHPLSYATWERIAPQHGFTGTRLLARHPSRVLSDLYSALSLRPA